MNFAIIRTKLMQNNRKTVLYFIYDFIRMAFATYSRALRSTFTQIHFIHHALCQIIWLPRAKLNTQ